MNLISKLTMLGACILTSGACAFAEDAQTNMPPAASTEAPATAAPAAASNAPISLGVAPGEAATASTNIQAKIASLRAEQREINTKLAEYRQRATNAPAVQVIFDEYKAAEQERTAIDKKLQEIRRRYVDALKAEIVKQEPSAQQLLDRQEALMKEMQTLVRPGMPLTNRPPRAGGAVPINLPSAAPNRPAEAAPPAATPK